MKKVFIVMVVIILITASAVGCSKPEAVESQTESTTEATVEETTEVIEVPVTITPEDTDQILWGQTTDEIEYGVPIKVSFDRELSGIENITKEALKNNFRLYSRSYIDVTDEELNYHYDGEKITDDELRSFTEEEFKSASFESLRPYLLSYFTRIAYENRGAGLWYEEGLRIFLEERLSRTYDIKAELEAGNWDDYHKKQFESLLPKNNDLFALDNFVREDKDFRELGYYLILKETAKTDDEKYIVQLLENRHKYNFEAFASEYFFELNAYLDIKNMYQNDSFADPSAKEYMSSLLKSTFETASQKQDGILEVRYQGLMDKYNTFTGVKTDQFYNHILNGTKYILTEADKTIKDVPQLALPQNVEELLAIDFETYKNYVIGTYDPAFTLDTLQSYDYDLLNLIAGFNLFQRVYETNILDKATKDELINTLLSEMNDVTDLSYLGSSFVSYLTATLFWEVVEEEGQEIEIELLSTSGLTKFSINNMYYQKINSVLNDPNVSQESKDLLNQCIKNTPVALDYKAAWHKYMVGE